MFNPVNSRIHGAEPGKFGDGVFLSAAHDIEEMFLGDLFDVCIESASVVDCTSFVHGLVHIADSDGGGEFLGGETVFPDKLPVNARDISIRVH